MITVLDLRGGGHDLAQVLPRAALDVEAAMDAVRPIVAQVRDGGVRALLDLGERLDGVRPASLRVPADDLARALDALDPAVRAALEESVRRARLVHGDQRREEHVTRLADGGTVTARWLPVDRVGLYVPGGRAVYPSSVVMNVVPALEAGVESLAISSPPQRAFGGLPHPTILAAAALLGVEEVYAVGGAQAVAMFAYGARDDDGTLVCRPVELVTGPGNIWVTAAKRLLKGRIGIDSEAGPTEIAILADDTADPRWVAADLVSQAEHDVVAAAVLVTPSEALAGEVLRALTAQVPQTRHADRIREALGGPQSAVVLVDDLEAGLDVVNAYAAEHLEIHTRSPASVARRVRNAGAVFVGPFAPVSLGDYCAGSNHVLPTGGSARHSSGLSVQTFLRAVHLVEYDERALQAVSGHVLALAEAEDLPAHGQAVSARLSGSTGTAGGAAATPRLSARARVATDAPGRGATQRVSHLGRKVEFETSGPASTFALGAGGAGGSIEEGEGVLVLTAHAPDATGLATVKDVLGRHLERFGERAGLRVTWQDDGPHGPAGA